MEGGRVIGRVGRYGRCVMVDAGHYLHAGHPAYSGSDAARAAEQVYI